jgi:hypothetical protein
MSPRTTSRADVAPPTDESNDVDVAPSSDVVVLSNSTIVVYLAGGKPLEPGQSGTTDHDDAERLVASGQVVIADTAPKE